MSGKKKGLGRGLSALFGDDKSNDKPQEIHRSNTVSISDLSRNPYQPRQHFGEDKLEELANSIKKNGIIQPIAVRPKKDENGKYEIVANDLVSFYENETGHSVPTNALEFCEKRFEEDFNKISTDGEFVISDVSPLV